MAEKKKSKRSEIVTKARTDDKRQAMLAEKRRQYEELKRKGRNRAADDRESPLTMNEQNQLRALSQEFKATEGFQVPQKSKEEIRREENMSRREAIMEDFRAGQKLGEEFVPTGSTGRLELSGEALDRVESARRDRAIQKTRSEALASARDLSLMQGARGVQGGAADAARASLMASAGRDISRIAAESSERGIEREVALDREEQLFNIEAENRERLAQLGGGTMLAQIGSAERSGAESARLQAEATKASSGGGKVICTELHRQGFMSDELFTLDRVYGQLTAFLEPDLMKAYHKNAKHVVALMRKSSIFTKVVAGLVNRWARYMASEIMPSRYSTDFIGKLVHRIGRLWLKK